MEILKIISLWSTRDRVLNSKRPICNLNENFHISDMETTSMYTYICIYGMLSGEENLEMVPYDLNHILEVELRDYKLFDSKR